VDVRVVADRAIRIRVIEEQHMVWWRRRRLRFPGRIVVAVAAAGMASLVGPAVATPAHAASTPRGDQWYIDAMQIPQIWKLSKGDGITVAVVDGGVDGAVPDLQGQVLPGKNFSPNVKVSVTSEDENHGTAMAAMIAGTGHGDGGNGGVGIAPGVKILPLRVSVDLSAANDAAAKAVYIPQVAQAIRYAADSPARIINLSIGVETAPAELRSAVSYALSKGKLLFAAVGNSGQEGNEVQYPAGIPGVVGVSALDKNGNVTKESESGPQVALAAPGDNMVHACTSDTGYCQTHGTSDATAVVSGSAALVWAKHPSWTSDEVLRSLIKTAKTADSSGKRSDYIGYGLVRPRRAMEYTGNVGPADVNPLLPDVKPSASASAPASASASAAASPASTAASTSGGGGGSTPWIVGGAVVVVAAVAVLVLVRRRAR
jgi:type VII secretion-associated serine protease mycosin